MANKKVKVKIFISVVKTSGIVNCQKFNPFPN